MTSTRLRWPATTGISLLAALATWVALWSWAGLVEGPSGYLVPALMVCLLVAVTGVVLRSLRVHPLLVPLAQVAVLLLWVTRTWARDPAWGGWLPTPASMREVIARVEGGLAAAQAYAAPVPDDAPIIFALLIAGAAGIALLVDFIACGLRRVPLAGLPMLAVYTVPVSILPDGVPWWVFAAGALSFLALLATEEAERLAHWGRQISGSGRLVDSLDAEVNTQTMRSSARKIGLTATGLAVVVPIFLPTLSTSLFGGGGSGIGGDGDAVSISNPMADLRRDLVRGEDIDLVRVTTPERDPSYLRISVLDTFDGKTWRPSGRDIPVEQRADGRLPRPPGLEPSVPRREVPYSIEIGSDFDSKWLPAPYPSSYITVQGDWRYDTSTLDFVSAADGQTTEDVDYSLRALKLDPTAQSLASAAPALEEVFTPYTALPSSMPDMVRDLAREVTRRERSRFEKAVALQDWFREKGGFTYSTARSAGNGIDELEQFLGTGPDSRVGYCEQFAAAMAVMGRALGIPSRVAVGFLRPESVADNTFVYSAHDLHAWPELYFEGTGWLRFEPTPQARANSVPGYTSQVVPTDSPSTPELSDEINADQNRFDRETQAPGAADSGNNGGSGAVLRATLSWLGAFVGVLVLLGGPRLARAAVRRRRLSGASTPVEVAEAAWAELRDTALDLGLAWDDTVTLRTRARALVTSFGEPSSRTPDDQRLTRLPQTGAAADPEAAHGLERLVKHVERARYARSTDTDRDAFTDLDLCVQALRNGVSRQRRAVATWFPASLLKNLDRGLRGRQQVTEEPTTGDLGVDHAV